MAWLRPVRGEVRFAIELDGAADRRCRLLPPPLGRSRARLLAGAALVGPGLRHGGRARRRAARVCQPEPAGLLLRPLRRQLRLAARARPSSASRPSRAASSPAPRAATTSRPSPTGSTGSTPGWRCRCPRRRRGRAGAAGSASSPAPEIGTHPHEVPRSGQDLREVGRRRQRLRLVPAREVHRVRRTRRRRRRQGRRRVGGMRRQPQHAHRLPLPPALQGPGRPRRHGQEPLRRLRRRRGDPGAAGNRGAGRGPGDGAGRDDRARRARPHRARRQRRLRQCPLQVGDQPGAAPRQPGPARRGADDLAAG